ncbi:MAG: septum formation initiator family protein [Spirochaetales bacterium]|nr:septum formation initiator family protein [Spirochaetales bacterium]
MMKLSSLLTALLLGIASYLAFEIIFGSYGVIAYRLMDEYADGNRARLESLYARREELLRQVHLLTTDAETLRIEARDSGLIARDEYVLRIVGREARSVYRYSPGAFPDALPRTRDNRPLFRAIGLTVALLYLLIDIIITRPRRDRVVPRRADDEWEVEIEDEKRFG